MGVLSENCPVENSRTPTIRLNIREFSNLHKLNVWVKADGVRRWHTAKCMLIFKNIKGVKIMNTICYGCPYALCCECKPGSVRCNERTGRNFYKYEMILNYLNERFEYESTT